MKILIIVHIFYDNLIWDLIKCIKNIIENNNCSIYFTYCSLQRNYKNLLKNEFPKAKFYQVVNKGYDIWPFFFILNQVNLNKYDLIVKLHTKRNMPQHTVLKRYFYCPGAIWREHLLSFCSTKESWSKAQEKFLKYANVGMISDSLVIFNYEFDPSKKLYLQIKKMMQSLNLQFSQESLFVAGTMFVVKASMFKCLQGRFYEKSFQASSYLHIDGLPHALERLLGFVVCAQGYKVLSYDNKDYYKEFLKKKICSFFYFKQVTRKHIIYRIFGIPVYIKFNSNSFI